MKIKLLSLSAIALFGLSGCGGGSSSSTSTNVTGQFIDAAVAGLNYTCSSGKEGVTDINGYFTCKQGDNVDFSINGFSLGSVKVQNLITPITLAPDDNTTVTNIAQLLQTLDSDGNPDNGITINKNDQKVQNLKDLKISLNAADFDNVVASHIGVTLVNETTAMSHLNLSVKNAKNNTGITSTSNVVIATGITQAYCSAKTYTNATYEGYGTYEYFVNAGGSATIEYFPTTKSCSEYSTAGFCNVQQTPLGGNGSCVTVVTYPKTTQTDPNTLQPPVLTYSFSVDSNYDVEYTGNNTYLNATSSNLSLINLENNTTVWSYTPNSSQDIDIVGITNDKVIVEVEYSNDKKLEYINKTDGTLLSSGVVDSALYNLKKLKDDGSLILANGGGSAQNAVLDTNGATLFNINGNFTNTKATDTTIIALDSAGLIGYDFNGTQRWDNNTSCTNWINDNDNIYCTQSVDQNTTALIKINVANGTTITQQNFKSIYLNDMQQSTNTIYTMLSSWDDNGYFHQKLVAIDKNTLAQKWSVNTYGKVVGLDISKKVVYLTDDAGKLKAYNTDNGSSIFNIPLNLSSYMQNFKVEDDGSIFVNNYLNGNYEYKLFKY